MTSETVEEKKVTLTVEVPAKLWDKYIKMFGEERFPIFWSSVFHDTLDCLEDDSNYLGDSLHWTDEVVEERKK